MSIPNKATGAGNNNAANVFKITFNQALSTPPKYEAYDNSQTFPEKDNSGSTIDKEIFTGTYGNSYQPYLYLVDTNAGDSSPGSDWKPDSAVAGSNNPNRLKGILNYVIAENTPSIGEYITFNIGLEVPYDASVPSDVSCNFILQIRYTYTGTAPSLTYSFNEGTEGSPSWTTLTPGTHGIRFCNSGTSSGGPYKLTLSASGTVDAEEVWVTS